MFFPLPLKALFTWQRSQSRRDDLASFNSAHFQLDQNMSGDGDVHPVHGITYENWKQKHFIKIQSATREP